MNIHFTRAVAAVGGQTALASALSTPDRKIHQSHIQYWLRVGLKAPEFAKKIQKLTKGFVKAKDLCPEVFG